MNLHTRFICDACRVNLATIERSSCWFCVSCDASIIPFEIPSESSSSPDVNAATADCQSPAVAATFSVSDGAADCSLPSGESEPSVTLALVPSESASQRWGRRPAVAASPLSPQVVAAAGTNSDAELDSVVSSLEAGWLREKSSVAFDGSYSGISAEIMCARAFGYELDALGADGIPSFLRRSADNVPPFAIRAADIDQNSNTSRTFAASEIAPKFSVSMDDVSAT